LPKRIKKGGAACEGDSPIHHKIYYISLYAHPTYSVFPVAISSINTFISTSARNIKEKIRHKIHQYLGKNRLLKVS
jgi:hypothetical protein